MAFNDNAPSLVADFVRNYATDFPVGFASRASVQEYLEHSPGKPSYVPELVFIDRNRSIRAQYSGAEDFFKDQDKNIRELVESLLKEPAAKKNGHSARKKHQ